MAFFLNASTAVLQLVWSFIARFERTRKFDVNHIHCFAINQTIFVSVLFIFPSRRWCRLRIVRRWKHQLYNMKLDRRSVQ